MKGKIKDLGWLLIVIFILSGCGVLSGDPSKPPTYSNEQEDSGKSDQDIGNATLSLAQEQVNSKWEPVSRAYGVQGTIEGINIQYDKLLSIAK